MNSKFDPHILDLIQMKIKGTTFKLSLKDHLIYECGIKTELVQWSADYNSDILSTVKNILSICAWSWCAQVLWTGDLESKAKYLIVSVRWDKNVTLSVYGCVTAITSFLYCWIEGTLLMSRKFVAQLKNTQLCNSRIHILNVSC